MLDLTRTVRFSINPVDAPADTAVHNGFAGHPAMTGLGRHYEMRITCRGEPDPRTGYFLNIKQIDEAARRVAIPVLEGICRTRPEADPAAALATLLPPLSDALGGRLHAVRWQLSPTYSVQLDAPMTTQALIRQRFEFAAAHRLHIPELTDAENKRIFGKCNNPSGHGHNYHIEPCVRVDASARSPSFTLADLERLTDQTIIERFDHKHLNKDTTEFGPEGLNPSVENIARVCYDLLAPVVEDAGAELHSVTVWETDKTSCTYPV